MDDAELYSSLAKSSRNTSFVCFQILLCLKFLDILVCVTFFMFYSVKNKQLLEIPKKEILEKDVQSLVEANLTELFDLTFVATEFSIDNVRFDTLAFDEEANTPVIIEFKKSFEKSLFDQGLEYLNILFSRKADFAINLHKKLGISPDPDKLDWENARVIFIGEQYSERQKRAVSFQGLPVELWRFNWLENDIFQLERESLDRNARLSEFAKSINNENNPISKIRREVKDYGREYHKKKASEKTWELFENIEAEIMNWNKFEVRYRKLYVGFYDKKSFCTVKLFRSKIQVGFGKKRDSTLLKQIKGVQDISHLRWNHAFMFEVESEKDLTDLFFILKKSLKNL